MYPVIFSLTDSLSINSYGLLILLGVIASLGVAYHDTWVQQKQLWPLWNPLVICLALGILVGSKFLFCINNCTTWYEFIAIHQGGFSVLGGVAGALVALYLFSYIYKICLLKLMDVLAVYMPLVQAFSRVGCFLAGCCSGAASTAWWALAYPQQDGGLLLASHPVQLYSAAAWLFFFGGLYYFRKSLGRYPGLLAGIYLLFSVIERLSNDFFRYTPTFCNPTSYYSADYLAVYSLSLIGFMLSTYSLYNAYTSKKL